MAHFYCLAGWKSRPPAISFYVEFSLVVRVRMFCFCYPGVRGICIWRDNSDWPMLEPGWRDSRIVSSYRTVRQNMVHPMAPHCILLLCLVTGVVSQIPDLGTNPRIFESDALPQQRFMASVGNGQLATVIHSDTVFMNGVYNGERGESHRARIPSRVNIRIQPAVLQSPRYVLDTEKGTFTERGLIEDVQIEQITFAHRLHTPLIVVQMSANFSQSALDSVTFNVIDNAGADSADITFTPPQDFQLATGKEQTGTTKVVEDSKFQPDPTQVYVVYSDVPETVTLTVAEPTVTFVMSVASTYQEASEAYLNAIQSIEAGRPFDILQSHTDQWAEIWKAGNIILEGPNLELAKVVAGSMYYLMSSLPYQVNESQRKRFYGLSPGSLAYGALLSDYQGHSFWDTETWMYPPTLLLWPQSAKDLLLYRMANVGPARERANQTGYKGIRYPWESGFTGVEVTPDCCPETRDNQQHITGDISYAARQYWAVTGDLPWLVGENYDFPLELNGCDFIYGMAEFWASRAELNEETGQYEINGVMPPDEDHAFVNNSIYTNVGAAFAISFAKYAECICSSSMSSSVPDEWLDIARKIKLPFDAERQYHPEFDGYTIGETIKQADVVLLGYPITYVTDPVEKRNDLDIYEDVTRPDGPAMTWAMHAIGWLDLEDDERAESLFNRSYQPYKIEPFKVWSEAQNQSGALNFITGMGGFLQALMAGYAGIRVEIDHLSFNPQLPLGTTTFTIQGLDYQKCAFDFTITQELVRVISTGESCQELAVTPGPYQPNAHSNILLHGRETVEFSRQRFSIHPISPASCSLPQ